MKIYITFGQSHVHYVDGKTINKDTVVVIECDTYQHGRKIAFGLFGDKFFTSCEKADAEMLSYYPA